MKVIIIDDERHARESLQDKLEQIPSLTVMAEFDNQLEAFVYLEENPIDVVFLDIEMYEMSGIEMAKRIKDVQPTTNIVFVTGYPKYAVDAFDADASDYLLKPATVERIETALSRLRNPVLKSISRIQVKTFGNFEIFADDKPIIFSRSKSKELLAYLVDRKGAGVSKKEIAAILWEDDEYTRSKQNQLQVFVFDMMKDLKKANADHIIIKNHNSLSVDIRKFKCDYYDFNNGNANAVNHYTGEYMTQYSWGEFTLGSLYNPQ